MKRSINPGRLILATILAPALTALMVVSGIFLSRSSTLDTNITEWIGSLAGLTLIGSVVLG